jgi:hypothetical protein
MLLKDEGDWQHAALCVLHLCGAKDNIFAIREDHGTVSPDGKIGSVANRLAPGNHHLPAVLKATRFKRPGR